jgi:protein required for attachment to host cells
VDTWVLVADEHRGRILALEADGQQMHEVCGFVNPARALSPPMGPQAQARRARHASQCEPAYDQNPPPASVRFARQLAAALDAARLKRAFAQLVLVAPPRFMGVLRPALPDASASCVVRVLPKHLIDAPVSDIHAALLH